MEVFHRQRRLPSWLLSQPLLNLKSPLTTAAVTTSLVVAKLFLQASRRCAEKIRTLDCSPEFCARNFAETSISVNQPNGGTRKLPCYQITRDGFAFLATGFTGKRAARFKEAYINAFNQMERSLSGAGAADMSSVAKTPEAYTCICVKSIKSENSLSHA